MLWLIAALAVGGLLAAAIVTFGLRRSVLVFAAVVLAGLIGLIWYAEFHDPGEQGFPLESLSMQGFTVRETAPGQFRVSGRLFNNSTDHALRGFELKVLAKDCTAKDKCVVIGDQGFRFDLHVPATQARDIEHVFQFSNMRPQGTLAWDFQVLPRD